MTRMGYALRVRGALKFCSAIRNKRTRRVSCLHSSSFKQRGAYGWHRVQHLNSNERNRHCSWHFCNSDAPLAGSAILRITRQTRQRCTLEI